MYWLLPWPLFLLLRLLAGLLLRPAGCSLRAALCFRLGSLGGICLFQGLPGLPLQEIAVRTAQIPGPLALVDDANVKHAVLLAELIRDDHGSEPGQGQSEPAFRIAGAADESRAAVAPSDDQLGGALLAGAHDLVRSQPVLERLADALLVLAELIEDRGEHDPGLLNDRILLDLLLGDEGHILLQSAGHLRLGDGGRILLQRIHHGIGGIGGPHGISLHISSGIELADDIVPGGLGPQPQLVHELDELALAEACRRLRLLGLDAAAEHGQPLALLQLRQDMLLCLAVRIIVSPAGLDEPRSAGPEGFGADVHLEAGGIPDAILGQGGEEAAHHQLINPPLILLQLALVQDGRRVNGRMVGGGPLAARGLHLSLEQPLRLG